MTDTKTLQDAARASINATPKVEFDKTRHQPPRIDSFGFNKVYKAKLGDDGSNILQDKTVSVPSWWGGANANGPRGTRTELMENRKRDNLPHISYDLDGDGFVGNRDYVISKIYDKDGDGKLNAQERKNAEEGVKNVSTLTVICRESRISSSGTSSRQAHRDPSESSRSAVFSWTARTSSP